MSVQIIFAVWLLALKTQQCLSDCTDKYGNSLKNEVFVGDLFRRRRFIEYSIITCDSLSPLDGVNRLERSIQNLTITSSNILIIEPRRNRNIPISIENLWIQNVNLEMISENGFRGLDVTNALNLSRNKLSNIMKNYFNTLSNIQVLDLSHNQIKFIHPESFQENQNLNTLYLNNNDLKNLGGLIFNGKMAMKILDISQNPITHVDMSLIKNILKLEILKSNNLQLISEPISINDQLKEVCLHGNKIIKISNQFCNRATELIVLDLSRNAIKIVDDTCLMKMVALENLNISHNHISHDIMTQLTSDIKLKYLDISYNNFQNTTIGSRWNYPQLQELYMNAANINLTSIVFSKVSKSLTVLSLSQNNLPQVDSEMLKNLKLLVSLNLNYNNILSISRDAFGDLLNLIVLELRGNKIKRISSHLLRSSSLKKLDLSQNDLTEFAMGTFDRCQNLVAINLSHNHIKSITKYNFLFLRFIEEIYLHDNDLANIDGIRDLSGLKKISLYNNDWTCDYLFDILSVLHARSTNIIPGSSAQSPQHIKGISCNDSQETLSVFEVGQTPINQNQGGQLTAKNCSNSSSEQGSQASSSHPVLYVLVAIGICILLVFSVNVYVKISKLSKPRFMTEDIINM